MRRCATRSTPASSGSTGVSASSRRTAGRMPYSGARAGGLVGRSLMEAFMDPTVEASAGRAQEEPHPGGDGRDPIGGPGRPGARRPRAGDPARDGAWLVLEDVSELRRLQRIRAEFIDNLSHELRTPLTTVSLLAETLDPRGRGRRRGHPAEDARPDRQDRGRDRPPRPDGQRAARPEPDRERRYAPAGSTASTWAALAADVGRPAAPLRRAPGRHAARRDVRPGAAGPRRRRPARAGRRQPRPQRGQVQPRRR